MSRGNTPKQFLAWSERPNAKYIHHVTGFRVGVGLRQGQVIYQLRCGAETREMNITAGHKTLPASIARYRRLCPICKARKARENAIS